MHFPCSVLQHMMGNLIDYEKKVVYKICKQVKSSVCSPTPGSWEESGDVQKLLLLQAPPCYQ